MKKGDLIKIDFHAAGTVSTELEKVLKVDKNTVTIGDEYTEEQYQYQFDILTGKCLNDNTYGGGRRTLNPEHIL